MFDHQLMIYCRIWMASMRVSGGIICSGSMSLLQLWLGCNCTLSTILPVLVDNQPFHLIFTEEIYILEAMLSECNDFQTFQEQSGAVNQALMKHPFLQYFINNDLKKKLHTWSISHVDSLHLNLICACCRSDEFRQLLIMTTCH